MKKWLKRILLGLCLVALLAWACSYLLPATTRIVHTVRIQAAPETLYPRLATLRRWPEWTAWNTNRFPDVQFEFRGPATGVGSTMIARGKSSGDGAVEITRADPARGVDYQLDFEHGRQIFLGSIICETNSGALDVTWTLQAKWAGHPLKRYVGLVLDPLMGGDMQQGLDNLKRECEAGDPTP